MHWLEETLRKSPWNGPTSKSGPGVRVKLPDRREAAFRSIGHFQQVRAVAPLTRRAESSLSDNLARQTEFEPPTSWLTPIAYSRCDLVGSRGKRRGDIARSQAVPCLRVYVVDRQHDVLWHLTLHAGADLRHLRCAHVRVQLTDRLGRPATQQLLDRRNGRVEIRIIDYELLLVDAIPAE